MFISRWSSFCLKVKISRVDKVIIKVQTLIRSFKLKVLGSNLKSRNRIRGNHWWNLSHLKSKNLAFWNSNEVFNIKARIKGIRGWISLIKLLKRLTNRREIKFSSKARFFYFQQPNFIKGIFKIRWLLPFDPWTKGCLITKFSWIR